MKIKDEMIKTAETTEGRYDFYDESATYYLGSLKNGIPHGHGIEYRKDGSKRCEGSYLDGRRRGVGTEYDTRGNKIGTFVFSFGKYSFPDNSNYEGELRDGIPHGYGSKYREDGTIYYQGEFFDGTRHGRGVEYFSDGFVCRIGLFIDDIFIG